MSNRMAMNLDGFRNYVKHIGLILRVYNALYPILFKSFTTSWGFSLYSKATTKLIIVELLPATYVVSKFSVILSQVNIVSPHKEETFSP